MTVVLIVITVEMALSAAEVVFQYHVNGNEDDQFVRKDVHDHLNTIHHLNYRFIICHQRLSAKIKIQIELAVDTFGTSSEYKSLGNNTDREASLLPIILMDQRPEYPRIFPPVWQG